MGTYVPCNADEVVRLAGPIRSLFTSDSPNAPAAMWEIGNVVYDSGDATYPYKMYFSGGTSHGAALGNIYMASAPNLTDGGTWSVYGAVIAYTTLPMEDPYVIFDGTTYHLWAENKTGGTSDYGIAYWTSANGIAWTRQDSNGSPWMQESGSTPEVQDVSSPVLIDDNGTETCLYEARDDGNDGNLCVATMSGWGGSPSKDGGNPQYSGNSNAAGTVWDDLNCVPDDIKKIGSTFYLIWHGQRTTSDRFNAGLGTCASLTGTYTQSFRMCNAKSPAMFLGDNYVYTTSRDLKRMELYRMEKLAA